MKIFRLGNINKLITFIAAVKSVKYDAFRHIALTKAVFL